MPNLDCTETISDTIHKSTYKLIMPSLNCTETIGDTTHKSTYELLHTTGLQ